MEAACQGGRSRLVYHTEDFEAGNNRSVTSCLLLRVIEVGGHSDDGFLDLLTTASLGNGLALHQDF